MRAVVALSMSAMACTLALDPDQLQFAASAGAIVDAVGDVAAPPSDDGADPGTPPPADVLTDTSPAAPAIAYPGNGKCELAYDPCEPPISFGCPTTCPAAGWTLTFDAQGFSGAKTYAWTFGPVDGYKIDVDSASSKRPAVTLTVTGSLIGKAALSKFNLPLTLKVDGALQPTVPVVVTPVSGCADAVACPSPDAEVLGR